MKVAPFVVCMTALTSLCQCAPGATVQARLVRASNAAFGSVVVVLESRTSASLNKALLGAFSQGIDARVVAFDDIAALPPNRLAAAVRAEKPGLILALGPQAAGFTRDALGDIPSIFALVLNYRAHNLAEDGSNMVGIAMENSLVSEFTQFKMVYPELRRLVMPYCMDRSEGMVEEARRTLGAMGLRLQPVPIDPRAVDARLGLDHGATGDAVWLPSDATILSHAQAFIDGSERAGLPVFASVSGVLARAGAVAAIEVDIPSIGSQAARMAALLLSGTAKPSDIGVQAPNGTLLVVNLTAARRRGLNIPLRVMPFIGETINDLPQPPSAP